MALFFEGEEVGRKRRPASSLADQSSLVSTGEERVEAGSGERE